MHTSYVVDPDARIGNNVQIGPYSCIYGDVEIGDNVEIYNNVTIFPGARIGDGVKIFPGAVVAGVPQDLKFRGEKTLAVVGAGTTLRECSTVNRGTASKGITSVGENCLIMAYSHVAHDCRLGNGVILSNATQIAGEVVIDDYAREPISSVGLNTVGMHRRGFDSELIREIGDIYRIIYMSDLNVTNALNLVREQIPQSAVRDEIIEFIEHSGRGVIRSAL